MFNRSHNSKFIYISIFFIIINIFTILIPLVLESSNINYVSYYHSPDSDKALPNPSKFDKDNYTSIISEEEHGLGEISVTNLIFNELDIGFLVFNDSYPLLIFDYKDRLLNTTIKGMRYIETLESAKVDNLDESSNKRRIKVKLNETLEVSYNNSKEGYLIYHSRYTPSRLIDVKVKNRTQILTLNNETDYSVDENDFLVFEYDSYFQEGPIFNFSMYLTWEYDLIISDWDINQIDEDNVVMKGNEHNVTAKFNYQFKVSGRKYSSLFEFSADVEGVAYIEVALKVDLADKDLLNFEGLQLNDNIVEINEYIKTGNSISISLLDLFHTNLSLFSLNFTTIFILKFEESVAKTWTIDRLVAERNIRERIYVISLTSGPEHIFLKYTYFFEYSFNSDQLISTFAFFERDIEVFDINYTLTGKRGVKVYLPYLIRGEVCPFIIKYRTNENLRIVITDVIRMPLVGANIEIFYYNKSFGTYISNERVQPIGIGKSDGNGEILIPYVPRGNYTARVYYEGKFLKEANVDTYKDRNFIHTTAPHSPLWLIIFGSINAIILFIGIIFYLKYKKVR